MPKSVAPHVVKGWLSEPAEIAFLDVSEAGAFADGHPFFAVPLSYSRFELEIERLVPHRATRLVLMDRGEGAGESVAERAARRAEALGYTNVHVMTGGAKGWTAAGFQLFDGVNLPSKTFGELIEHERHTPRITAAELIDMTKRGDDFVIVDGRTWDEYTKFNIPGGISCPNGELVLRIDRLAPNPKTRIVVNCAGRTRSIIGAQTLIDFGVANEVVALENGTQGWWLLGHTPERGADRRAPEPVSDAGTLTAKREQAKAHATKHGVKAISADAAAKLASDPSRTTYLFDIRTPEEFGRDALPGFVHAPGGQLQQATDQWVGIKGARMILTDAAGEQIRAPMVAAWLRQLGHEADVLDRDAASAAVFAKAGIVEARKPAFDAGRARLAEVAARDLTAAQAAGARVIDLRSSESYRAGRIPGSVWSIRPVVQAAAEGATERVILVADDPNVARLAALDLREAGIADVGLLSGGVAAWRSAGGTLEPSPKAPADAERIDFVFHTLGRNDGNLDAARAYLAWETDLVNRLDAQERSVFRL